MARSFGKSTAKRSGVGRTSGSRELLDDAHHLHFVLVLATRFFVASVALIKLVRCECYEFNSHVVGFVDVLGEEDVAKRASLAEAKESIFAFY